ncbi:hypothetical protein EYF80_045238 [Liparis tanakae]|uniref:Uncharacterized protein n=1 Tax=Liparis tanakae TaxID=230148 RepID=A0A4Z2FV65_9TELE|nr:hypothetical protein EYF80_045238 [Liparis tanakae]
MTRWGAAGLRDNTTVNVTAGRPGPTPPSEPAPPPPPDPVFHPDCVLEVNQLEVRRGTPAPGDTSPLRPD